MEVSGEQPSKPVYRKEIQEGVQLFEKSFKDLQKSKFDAQKEQYQKVMKESLQAIRDAAQGLMNEKLLKMKDQLANDYESYLSDPSQTNQEKVQHDIDSLRKSSE